MKAIERRLERLRCEWLTFVAAHNRREARYYRALGASAAIAWREWPQALLDTLAASQTDPAHIHGVLAAMDAEENQVIRIVWLDRGELSGMDPPPLVALQPGMLDLLRPDPRVTEFPKPAAVRKRLGDEEVTLVVSYTGASPRTAPERTETPIDTIVPPQPPERPQTPPQAPEPPYNFEEARRSTLALARRQDRTKRRLHVR